MTRICITGAAGNLGLLTARHLLAHSDSELHLMVHRKPLPDDVANHPRVRVFACDLGRPGDARDCLCGVNVVIHYASVLFKAHPERFMETTNTGYFAHMLASAVDAGVGRVILSSFPHVEGPTSPGSPSTDRIDAQPISIHARTRLAEERLLRERLPDRHVILRIGMVYGAGILMPDAARWFAERRLLGVWRDPTWIHLISRDDYLDAVFNAAHHDNVHGTYNLGDEGRQTLQDYLDFACAQWHCRKPWRMPDAMIYGAARLFEATSTLFHVASPLTRDFLDIGHISYYGDTRRMRADLLPRLKYPTMRDGAGIF